MAGGGVGEAALAAEALGAAEVAGTVAGAGAGAGFLEGMAGVSALEGAGVAGLGLGTGAGLTTGAGLAGGLGALSPAFQTALAETAVANPSIAAQFAQAANAGAVPSAASALGTGQIGDVAAQEAFRQASTAAATPGITPGVQPLQAQLPAVPNATPAFGPGSTAATLSSMPAPTAADIAQMANVGMPAAEPGLGSLLSQGYNAWKNSDPFIKYGSAGLAAARYLGKPTAAYAPPGYSGPLSKINISPNYRPYAYRPYAAGGPVEEMSRENAMGANTGYPQADIHQGAYATPWQTPVSRNVVAGADDANVDMMTGAERMAEGGETSGAAASSGTAAGDAGIAALGPMMYNPGMISSSLVDPAAAYAEAQPTMNMSRQNFQDFLSPYQNMPVINTMPVTPPPASGANTAPVQPGPNVAYYPSASKYGMMSDSELAIEADRLISTRPPGYQRELELLQGNNPAPVSAGYSAWDMYRGGMAAGGVASLGSYSDGGRLLRGPGDGMSDNIPASISGKQPARLADGEFVVPADVVSGLGNGSTDAGAKHLYSMMDKVRKARTGTKKQGREINPRKYLPA